jgi:sulfoxide reductase catalytic subunit YedY
MLIRHPGDILPSEITPRGIYLERRCFMQGMGVLVAGAALGAAPDATARGWNWLACVPVPTS